MNDFTVSQTLASEQIEDVGMSVVGWYHSHPTFSPDPSLRDIETQQKFQVIAITIMSIIFYIEFLRKWSNYYTVSDKTKTATVSEKMMKFLLEVSDET